MKLMEIMEMNSEYASEFCRLSSCGDDVKFAVFADEYCHFLVDSLHDLILRASQIRSTYGLSFGDMSGLRYAENSIVRIARVCSATHSVIASAQERGIVPTGVHLPFAMFGEN